MISFRKTRNLSSDTSRVGQPQSSVQFDAAWYLETNPDVAASGIDPYEHYINQGINEGRRPAPDALPLRVIRHYNDYRRRQPGIRGLYRLIKILLATTRKYGIHRFSDTIREHERLHSQALISKPRIFKKPNRLKDASLEAKAPALDVAVHAHIYYVELAREIRSYLESIPIRFDLYITTESSEKAVIIREALAGLPMARTLRVVAVENRGRDILPMVVALGEVLSAHEIVLHIHTKRSPHNSGLRNWRRYLLESLLGSSQRVTAILQQFAANPQLGILFPDPYQPIKDIIAIPSSGNKRGVEQLLARFNEKDVAVADIDQTFFPAGDMFWFRGRAIKPLVDLRLTAHEFDAEEGQVDGTLAHAIERLFPYLASKAGLHSESYIADTFLSPECSAHDIVLLKQYSHRGIIRSPALIFDNDLGGGTSNYAAELIEASLVAGRDVLRIYHRDCSWFIEWIGRDDGMLFYTREFPDLHACLAPLCSRFIVVNSLFGHPDIDQIAQCISLLGKNSEADIDFAVHDFFALCPSPHLCDLEEKYCGIPQDHTVCCKCLAHFSKKHWWYPSWYPESKRPIDIKQWRQAFESLFEAVTTLRFFDPSSVEIFSRAFKLDMKKVRVVPHKDRPFTSDCAVNLSRPLHIGILGTLTAIKGGNVVNDLCDYIAEHHMQVPITVLGRALFPTRPGIRCHGAYKIDELTQLVSNYGINIILMPSIVPETFSFVVSEAMQMQLPIVAFDLGAQGRRVRQYSRGRVLPLDASADAILSTINSTYIKAGASNSGELAVSSDHGDPT